MPTEIEKRSPAPSEDGPLSGTLVERELGRERSRTSGESRFPGASTSLREIMLGEQTNRQGSKHRGREAP
jgi:hypothetical protein